MSEQVKYINGCINGCLDNFTRQKIAGCMLSDYDEIVIDLPNYIQLIYYYSFYSKEEGDWYIQYGGNRMLIKNCSCPICNKKLTFPEVKE